MEITVNTRVGDVVKENFRTAQVFDKNNIDFCCGGGMSIDEACKNAEINSVDLITELQTLVYTNDPESRFINAMDLDGLCDYIEQRHHSYVNENLPFLIQKLDKLCSVHGTNHPELIEIRDLFEGAAQNLSAHMKKEELILFPYIRKMVLFKREQLPSEGEFADVFKTIDLMEDEHETEGKRFAKIASLTSNYSCPPDGCETYRVTFETLKDFEQDLHRHIHLENNILFVKAIELEKELIKD